MKYNTNSSTQHQPQHRQQQYRRNWLLFLSCALLWFGSIQRLVLESYRLLGFTSSSYDNLNKRTLQSSVSQRRNNTNNRKRTNKRKVKPPLPLHIPAVYSLNENGRFIIEWSGIQTMEALVDSIWVRNYFCDIIDAVRNPNHANHPSIMMNATTTTTTIPINGLRVNDSDATRSSSSSSSSPLLPITFQLRFQCQEMFLNSTTGTGNYIQTLYMMRLVAIMLEHVDIDIQCDDALQTQSTLILPWFTGHYPWNIETKQRIQQTAQLLYNITPALVRHETCLPFWKSPLALLHSDIQYDLRRMAIALVGSRPYPHPSQQFRVQEQQRLNRSTAGMGQEQTPSSYIAFGKKENMNPPLIPNVVELDDAVIHFRCGDLLATSLTNYGFMKFSHYTRHISSAAQTIGILTQPFDDDNDDDNSNDNDKSSSKDIVVDRNMDDKRDRQQPQPQHQEQQENYQQRPQDADTKQKQQCRIIVTTLQQYIQERFPNAIVTIRNRPQETIALSYARMVMANQTIGTMSTFSVFPVVATFGTGYFLRPGKWSPNVWLQRHPMIVDPFRTPNNNTNESHVVLFDTKAVMVGSAIRRLWERRGEQAVLKWFQS